MTTVTNAELKILMESLVKDVSMCSRTLRGSNGDPGMVTAVTLLTERLATLEKKVDTLEVKITNDLMHAIQAPPPEKSPIKFGSWEWFNEKALMPIIVAVTVSLSTWFLTKILPEVVSAIGK